MSSCSRATSSLDHLVGASEQRWRNVEPERLGRLEIEDELELGRTASPAGRPVSHPENAPGIDAGLAIGIGEARPVAHQAAGYDSFALSL